MSLIRWTEPHQKADEPSRGKRINVGPTAKARKAKAAKRLREYRRVCRLVDARDAHRCRVCSSVANLEHHHLQPRSLGRKDTTSNILVLCQTHHRGVGGRVGGITLRIRALMTNGADGPLEFTTVTR